MKTLQSILTFVFTLMLCQCASKPKLQEKAPTEFKEVYFQQWNAGVKEGGSGIAIYIKTKDNSVALDSVYFRGKATQLQNHKTNKNLFIGRFKTANNAASAIIMSSDTNEEIGNTVTLETPKIPFELKNNECVVSYKSAGKIKYYKITNIKSKATLNYPSAPSNNQ